MNLHAIAAPYIAAVNPLEAVTVKVSTGYTTAADGSRTPTFAILTLQAQVQALSYLDLQQVEGLNLQGTRRAMYLLGDIEGIQRINRSGGDVITRADGSVWLIAQVLESWGAPGSTDLWCKCAVTLQDGS